MNRFLQWFKDLVLPFEYPYHPLYYSKESELLEQARRDAALRFVIGNYTYERLFLNMPQFINGPRIANTIPAKNSKYFGHWNDSSMKPARDAAREAARADGYYARHTHY